VDFLYSFGGSWTNAQGKSNFASPQDIANNGGLGLWKDIHRFMAEGNQTSADKSSDVRL
jgi:ligand-binding SRPBCC domain-containing protein